MRNLGRYEIIEQLGQGTMGAVYKARDPMMDRDVAIKTILTYAIEGPEAAEFRARFFREARAAGRLAHRGIVTVFDVAEHEGIPFLVMEYVMGCTLQSILLSGERMNFDRVYDLGTQLAKALDYAHRNGVVHRDIKPANILVTNDDGVKIADFGIAKVIDSHVTSTGQLLGTPAFMAPEQFAGTPVDGRADLFALGAVIYWMATGDKPFTGDTLISVQYKVMNSEPVAPRRLNPAIPPALEAVILKSIQKDPAKRYQSGEQLARDLHAWHTGQPVLAPAVPEGYGDERTELLTSLDQSVLKPSAAAASRLYTRRILVIASLMLIVAITTFALIKSARQQPPAPPEATANIPVANPALPDASASPVTEPVTSPELQKDVVAPAAEVTKPASAVALPVSRQTTRSNKSPIPAAVAGNRDESKLASIPEPAPITETIPRPENAPSIPDKAPVAPPPRLPEPAQSYTSSQLLITSAAFPEPLTIIVSVDNEVLFRHDAKEAPPAGILDSRGRLQLRAIPTAPFSEERPLLPGRHKIQVNILLASQRVGKVQEVTDRFYLGQRRVLEIQFLPETQQRGDTAGDTSRFTITLR